MCICKVKFKVSNTGGQVIMSAKNEKHLIKQLKLRNRKYVHKTKDIILTLFID